MKNEMNNEAPILTDRVDKQIVLVLQHADHIRFTCIIKTFSLNPSRR